jgi:DNA-directed RNA polymerase subunit M/transcription elongation factor TFIIS
MVDHNTIDDLMPDPEAPQWVAIIECSECGFRGEMYSTGEPRETTVWDCDVCGYDDAIHHTIIKSNTSELVGR